MGYCYLRQRGIEGSKRKSVVAKERVGEGRYASLSEVIRAGLRALERKEQALDAVLKARVEAALADPTPSLPQAEVFSRFARAPH